MVQIPGMAQVWVWQMRALVVVTLLIPALPAQPREPDDVSALRTLALELVNEERRQRNLPAFEADQDLDEAAQFHAADMLKRHYYAHESPEGKTVMDRYIAAGGSRWQLVEENIAYCERCRPPVTRDDVERLHKGWMKSRPHRMNILDPGVDRFGFGVAIGDGGLYAVQTFAGPGTPRGGSEGEAAQPLTPEQVQANLLQSINQARRDQGAPPLAASPALAKAAEDVAAAAGDDGLDQDAGTDALRALTADPASGWGKVSMIAGGCGGCGTKPTAADVTFFRDQWLDTPQYRETLLDPDLTHLGVALHADGNGRKTAVALLGQKR